MAEKKEREQTIDANVNTVGKFQCKIEDKEDAEYPAVAGRYHLYYSTACPWCHRITMTIILKGLQDIISMSDVEPLLLNLNTDKYIGWEFNDKYPDPLHKDKGFKSVYDLYKLSDKNYPNKALPVPILFDKKTDKIINNESGLIIQFLNSQFQKLSKNPKLNLNPTENNKIIQKMKEWDDKIYPNINNGVYKCGFAKTQEIYNENIKKLFDTLDEMEKYLDSHRYLGGDSFTFSDIKAFVTLIRFDKIYVMHYKCNKKQIYIDYPNINNYLKEIYQMDGISQTCDDKAFEYIKKHYFVSQKMINPYGIIPDGPNIDYSTPHGRDKKKYDNSDDQKNDK